MAMAKSTAAEIPEIQRRMAQVRHELHVEVQEAVKGAQSLTDWRSLVRNYPWLTLGSAAAAGYLIVPRRRSETPTVMAVAPPAVGASLAVPLEGQRPRRGSRFGLVGTAFGLLAPIAVRAAQNYALQYLEQWLVQQPGERAPAPGGSSPGPGPGGPAGTNRAADRPGWPRGTR